MQSLWLEWAKTMDGALETPKMIFTYRCLMKYCDWSPA